MIGASWDAPGTVLVVTATLGGIAAIVSAFFSGWAAMRSGRAAEMAQASKDVVVQTHATVVAVAAKTDVIEAQGNSKATADAAQIKSLQEKLEMVIRTLDKSEQRALDLAKLALPMKTVPDQLGRIEEATSTVAKVISEALHATPEAK